MAMAAIHPLSGNRFGFAGHRKSGPNTGVFLILDALLEARVIIEDWRCDYNASLR